MFLAICTYKLNTLPIFRLLKIVASRLGKRDRPDQPGTESNVVVQRGRGRGRVATTVVQGDVGQYVAGRMESSVSDPLVLAGFAQPLQDASVSVRMCSTDSEGLSRRLQHNNGNYLLSVCAEEGQEPRGNS